MSLGFRIQERRSFIADVESLSNERLLFAEKAFLRRVIEGMPLAHHGQPSHDADRIIQTMMADEFERWFAPEREKCARAWDHDGRGLAPAVEQAYQMFLEKIGLRRGDLVAEDEGDSWAAPQRALDQEVEIAAEAFRCAVQQRQGWIDVYEALLMEGGPERCLEYLRVANFARGFLLIREAGKHERSTLAGNGLEDRGGAVLVREQRWAGRAVSSANLSCLASYQRGLDIRQAYDSRVEISASEWRNRRAFAEILQTTIKTFGETVLLGPHLADNVKKHAQNLVKAEQEYLMAATSLEKATSAEEKKNKEQELVTLERRRAGAREALSKSRALLRVYDEAVRLGIVPEKGLRGPFLAKMLLQEE